MRAGFVLVGGRSSRMGRDKATLPLAGGTLAGSIAARVAEAALTVTLVGSPQLYGALGYRVIPDLIPGSGPLGAVYTALQDTAADWNLIVACDMPDVTVALFEDLFAVAERSGADCVAPGRADSLHPLCAVYHRRCAPKAADAIHRNFLKMHDFVSNLQTMIWPLKNWAPLSNINTIEEWSAR
jgi:molybdopterin-guanine dinucleotide biosynthesis protein A